jgi:hypothetical protein
LQGDATVFNRPFSSCHLVFQQLDRATSQFLKGSMDDNAAEVAFSVEVGEGGVAALFRSVDSLFAE